MLRGNDLDVTGKSSSDALNAVFAQLYRRHELALHRLVLRVTRSEQQAKDIVQEVFLKLWEHKSEIHTIRNMEAWLYRVTENKLMDFLRKTAADQRLREALWKKTSVSVRETEELLQAKESHSILHQAVSQLPPQRRLIYQLNREKGLNYQEIAQALSISRHTVKNQLSMALRTIQRFLLSGISILLFLLGSR